MPTSSNSDNIKAPVAPWWHTALVLLVISIGSVASAYQHGFANLNLPGLNVRLSGYVTVLAEEWFLALLIWLAMRRRGQSLAILVSGRWQSVGAFLKDFGLAVGFLAVGIPLTSAMTLLLKASSMPAGIFPKTPLEAMVWVFLAATAGFCEELVFRGYLMQQFTAWTNSRILGIGIQGLAFGLAHGYQGRFMIVITAYGWLFGLFAAWRKSLRPGMLAHGLQDGAGGLIAYFFVK
jgi:membrane protease YdiL (CAAX protease family)